MYLKNYLENFNNKKIKLYVDMDGVIADYEVGVAAHFDKKRPLVSSISKLEEISKMNNVELFILSVSRMDEGVEQKQVWLDKFAPFFKKENRVIIPRESNDFKSSAELKSTYLKNIERSDNIIVVIDDDPIILKTLKEKCEGMYLLKDTALVD